MVTFLIGKQHRHGWFDSIELEQSGLARIKGWCIDSLDEMRQTVLVLNQEIEVFPLHL